MKVAAYYGPGDVRVEDRPVPTPGPHQKKIFFFVILISRWGLLFFFHPPAIFHFPVFTIHY